MQERPRSDEPTVYLVDDDAGVRRAAKGLIESVGLRVEAFASAREFLEFARPDAPGCLILDVRLPGVSGLDLQRELEKKDDPLPIIFITAHGDIPMTVQAMKAGAVEFLSKPFRDQQLLDAIAQAIDRDRLARKDRREVAELQRRYDSLTPREREVMTFVVKGLLNKQVGAELGMSETTVKLHRGQVMQKMKADSLADLVRMSERLLHAAQESGST
ncbi:MAG TPA: response regulator transcription factor [Myxococcales bacterium]|nr:response regulator transcription factor [Myxococcales bacterium]